MRDLTQQEIDSAPEWATHYQVTKPSIAEYLIWDSEYIQSVDSTEQSVAVKVISGIDNESKPIPRQQFNITEGDLK